MRAHRINIATLRLAAALVIAGGATASCKRAPTGLRVLVSTDFRPTSTSPALEFVRLRVTRMSDGAELHAEDFNVGSGGLPLPLKFSVFLTGSGGERVRIEAEAHTVETQAGRPFVDARGRFTGALTTARVITGFVEGDIRVVPVVLYRGCWDARLQCEPESTCGPSATCQSAQVDQRELPPFDRDAGDPDVTLPTEMDAGVDSAVDAIDVTPIDRVIPPDVPAVDVRPADVPMPPPDAPCSALPIGTSTTLMIAGSNATTGLFDIASRDTMAPMMDGGMPAMPNADIEVAWGGPFSPMMLNANVVSTARLQNPGSGYAVTRGPRETNSFGIAPLQTLSLLRNGGEIGVFGLEEEPMPTRRLRLLGAPIDATAGLGMATTFIGLGPFTMPSMTTRTKNSAVAVVSSNPMAMGPNVVACILSDTERELRCRYTNPMATMAFDFSVDFSSTAAAPGARLVALAVGGPGSATAERRLQFVLQASNNLGYLLCSSMNTVPPMTPTDLATCGYVPAVTTIRAGSLSAQWIDAFNCGGGMMSMQSGWFGALVESGAGMDTLRAGKLEVVGFMSDRLAVSTPVSSVADTRTAVSVAPAPCEMLVGRVAAGEVEYRRALLSGAVVGAPALFSAHTNSALRAVPLAPPSRTMGADDHVHAFVDSANRVNVVVVPATSCRM